MVPRTRQVLLALSLLSWGCGGESQGNSSGTGGTPAEAGAGGGGNAGTSGNGSTGGAGSAGVGGGGNAGTGGTRSFTPDQGCLSDQGCAGDQRGSTCFRFGDDGPGTCGRTTTPVTECATDAPSNECCSSDECTDARCFSVMTQPVQCSATGGFDVVNECVSDTCATDDDCPSGVCSPEGLGNGRACIPAHCEKDSDCDDQAGGVCTYFDLGCCATQVGGAPTRARELVCVYPSSGCQADSDCPDGEYCVVRDGRAECSATCP
jgi:hypothetical protein